MKAFGTAVVALGAAVWGLVAERASADELVMPYACSVRDGAVTLTPSAPIGYTIQGRREEQAFQDCAAGTANAAGGACTTISVHRFTLACTGGLASWQQVADAGLRAGISMPAGLPRGFAPITQLQARIVLPALARFSPHKDAVSSEMLHADSIVYHSGATSARDDAATWQTVVKAEMRPQVTGMAFRVAGIVTLLLASFFALGLYAARQPAAALGPGFAAAVRRSAGRFAIGLQDVLMRVLPKSAANSEEAPNVALSNALAIAAARLAEAELVVAALPRALAIRDVLQGELDGVRARLDAVAKGIGQKPHEKSAAQIRSILRDLLRISRIAQGAVKDTAAEQSASSHAASTVTMPASLQEAYHILGLNGDAAPNVAKKLVDALRMTWHPDFARDEDDRRVREARMKQINAAWDLIKSRPAQAA